MKKKSRRYAAGVLCILCVLYIAACSKETGGQGTPTPVLTHAADLTQTSSPTQGGTLTPTPVKKPTGTPVPTPATADLAELVTGTAWELGNLQGNLFSEGWFCESDGELYYRDYNNEGFLCRAKPDGTGKQVLSEDIPRGIQVMGDWVYYNVYDGTGNYIKRIRKDGGEAELIGEDAVAYMLVAEDWIFYNAGSYIAKMRPDGSERTVLCEIQENTGGVEYAWLSIYGDCLFCEDVLGGQKLYAVKTDGSGQHLVDQDVMYPVVHGSSLYYLKRSGGLQVFSFLTGEGKSMKEMSMSRSVLYKGRLYFNNAKGIFCIGEDGKEKQIYSYMPEKRPEEDLFWAACDRIYFIDYTDKNAKEETLQYFELETGKTGIVQ